MRSRGLVHLPVALRYMRMAGRPISKAGFVSAMYLLGATSRQRGHHKLTYYDREDVKRLVQAPIQKRAAPKPQAEPKKSEREKALAAVFKRGIKEEAKSPRDVAERLDAMADSIETLAGRAGVVVDSRNLIRNVQVPFAYAWYREQLADVATIGEQRTTQNDERYQAGLRFGMDYSAVFGGNVRLSQYQDPDRRLGEIDRDAIEASKAQSRANLARFENKAHNVLRDVVVYDGPVGHKMPDLRAGLEEAVEIYRDLDKKKAQSKKEGPEQ